VVTLKNKFCIFFIILLGITSSEKTCATTIYTSIDLWRDILTEITPKNFKIKSFIPKHSDPHNFSPTPKDLIQLTKSSVLVVNGFHLEEKFLKILKTHHYKGKMINLQNALKGDDVISFGHHESDPHYWHSINNVLKAINYYTTQLGLAYPQYKASLKVKSNAYKKKLQEVKEWIDKQWSMIPVKKRNIVSLHNAFGYIQKDYQVKFISPLLAHNEAMPTPRKLGHTISFIRKNKIRTLFVQAGGPSKFTQQILNETEIKKTVEIYADGPGKSANVSTYLMMMKYNTEQFVNSLKEHALKP
jgi:zinc/manganese transport system substrate-binding protein